MKSWSQAYSHHRGKRETFVAELHERPKKRQLTFLAGSTLLGNLKDMDPSKDFTKTIL